MSNTLNGAQSVVQTLVNCGVEVCFANPGTSEMHFVAALDSVTGLRPVLCLFEGVVTGAADGYGQIAGKPAVTLLHWARPRPAVCPICTTPSAPRQSSTSSAITPPIICNTTPPLTSDIVGFAAPVSTWITKSKSAGAVASDTARAVRATRSAPGGIATLIMPADVAWNPAHRGCGAATRYQSGPGRCRHRGRHRAAIVERQEIGASAARRRAARRGAGRRRPHSRRSARLGCCATPFAPQTELGAGRVLLERILVRRADHGVPEDVEQLILVGAKPPVSFFAYPGKPSWGAPEGCQFDYLAQPHQDSAGAEGSRGRAGCTRRAGRAPRWRCRNCRGQAQLARCRSGDRASPRRAIYAEEANTSGLPLQMILPRARPPRICR